MHEFDEFAKNFVRGLKNQSPEPTTNNRKDPKNAIARIMTSPSSSASSSLPGTRRFSPLADFEGSRIKCPAAFLDVVKHLQVEVTPEFKELAFGASAEFDALQRVAVDNPGGVRPDGLINAEAYALCLDKLEAAGLRANGIPFKRNHRSGCEASVAIAYEREFILTSIVSTSLEAAAAGIVAGNRTAIKDGAARAAKAASELATIDRETFGEMEERCKAHLRECIFVVGRMETENAKSRGDAIRGTWIVYLHHKLAFGHTHWRTGFWKRKVLRETIEWLDVSASKLDSATVPYELNPTHAAEASLLACIACRLVAIDCGSPPDGSPYAEEARDISRFATIAEGESRTVYETIIDAGRIPDSKVADALARDPDFIERRLRSRLEEDPFPGLDEFGGRSMASTMPFSSAAPLFEALAQRREAYAHVVHNQTRIGRFIHALVRPPSALPPLLSIDKDDLQDISHRFLRAYDFVSGDSVAREEVKKGCLRSLFVLALHRDDRESDEALASIERLATTE